MRHIQLSNDVVSIGELKTQAAAILRRIRQERCPVVITQHGRPAGVLISPQDFDELCDALQFVESVRRSISDSDSGKLVDDENLDLAAITSGPINRNL